MKNFIALVPFLLASICHAAGGYAPWGDQHWKTPVASVGTLPASGNNVGDVRIETTAFGEYVWNGSSWVAISGGGGGSGLTSINTDTTAAQLLTVGTAGTNFGIVDAGSGSHVFNLPTASASNRGALSSADWSTFNGKQSTLTLGNLTSTPTTNLVVTGGTGSVVGSGSLLTLTGASLVEATSAVLTISGGTNAVLGTGVSLQVKQASTSQSGYLSSTDWNTFNGKGAGTVTGASVVSANGFAGTVATSTTTPAITLSTSITGVLQGNGTAISAATTTGSGSVVLATSPTLVTPALGTPASGVMTNVTGTASGLTAGIATNIAGGLGGSIPYQTAVNTTAILANGSAGQFLASQGTTLAPHWITLAGKTTGEVFMTAATSCPTGAISADGTSELRSGGTGCGGGACANLFSAISTTYGAADGSHFTLPNMQGVFARGAGTQTISSITYTGSQGTSQTDQLQSHLHQTVFNTATAFNPGGTPGATNGSGGGASANTDSNYFADGANGTPRTGTETRPANITLLYCIVY